MLQDFSFLRDKSFQERRISIQPRVITGILYSLSRNQLGDIFPVYMGHNSIGRNKECEIRLQERTIDQKHAIIRVVWNEELWQYEATLEDKGSEYGSAVNGVDVRYDTVVLTDGDILEIGRHYRLLFKIFNTDRDALYEDEDFEDTSEPESESDSNGSDLKNLNSGVSGDLYSPTGKETDNDRTRLI